MLAEERAATIRRAAARAPGGATFLSHSSADADLLPGAIRLLESHGASVCVDKKDESLPPYTSRETAKALRDRIDACQKLVLLATPNSRSSRWVPWELGVADGLKSARNAALLPALESVTDTLWTEQEYLGIYDRIVWGDLRGVQGRIWMVLNQESNTATRLYDWLRR